MTVDGFGSIDYTTQSSDNKNLLVVANEISNMILGRDAGTTGRPTKTDIIREINKEHKRICNKHQDWTFLMATTTVDGYEADTTAVDEENVETTALNTTLFSSGGYNYYAQQFETSEDEPRSVLSVTGRIGADTGINPPTGVLIAHVCPDSNGSPDLDNPEFSSDTITVTADGKVGDTNDYLVADGLTEVDVAFTFSTGSILNNDTKYWIVFGLRTDAGAQMVISVNEDNTSETSKYFYATTSTEWSSYTDGVFYYNLNYYPCSFITEIEMPSDVRYIHRIYNSEETSDIKPFSNNRYIYDTTLLGSGHFVVRRTNTTGQLVVLIESSQENVMEWTVEYTKRIPELSSDEDLPLIPSDYMDIITGAVYLNFVAMGLVIAEPVTLGYFEGRRKELLADLEFDYRPDPDYMEYEKQGQTSRVREISKPMNNFEVE